ncbi:hypothetical protein BaRGS_00024009, partial [Batillaria attramentaria]
RKQATGVDEFHIKQMDGTMAPRETYNTAKPEARDVMKQMPLKRAPLIPALSPAQKSCGRLTRIPLDQRPFTFPP